MSLLDIAFKQSVLRELKEIKNELRELRHACSRMDGHISFVERTYNAVRHPMNYIINKLSGGASEELKKIKES